MPGCTQLLGPSLAQWYTHLHFVLQEQCKGHSMSAESSFAVQHSYDSSQSGDIILSVAESTKENKQPGRKEGQKSLQELQVRVTHGTAHHH